MSSMAPAILASMPRQRLGEWLIEQGMITADQLHIALLEQKRNYQMLGRILVAFGFVSETILRDGLATLLGRQSIDLAQVQAPASALALIPKKLVSQWLAFPLAHDPALQKLTLAVADPNNLMMLDRIRQHLGHRLTLDLRVASEADISQAIDRHYGVELSIDGILQEIETAQAVGSNPGGEPAQPVIRLIDALLADAIARQASDIHFEPEQGFVRIRYRIDGVLQPIRSLHKNCWPAMIVRLKVMAGMNIAENRSPQDGHIDLTQAGRQLDFRASIQPTLWGENFVLRILDRYKGLVPLSGLGLQPEQLQRLQRMLARPDGILLVTGPTGAGKTTTLYSILGHINSPGINIMTLEDPVEYPLPWLRQTSINDTVKMDFGSGIRSMLRQDPDVILIGEIRDHETAEMALRAAMTGHQVHATLHTQSAIGAIARLQNLGIAPEMLAGNLTGIIAQRLVRKLCQHCREAIPVDAHARQVLGLPLQASPQLYRARGCQHCNHSGYRGRFAIMESLLLNPELDALLANRASVAHLLQAAKNQGFRSLIDDARHRIMQGDTSLEEAARVIDLTAGAC